MPIHIGKTPSREGWLGFETDRHLTATKARLYTRCLPCMTGLYEQLAAKPAAIELTCAWECWKVTVVLADNDECLRVLEKFQDSFPEESVYGKFGGGVGRQTSAVIFHCEEEKRRDEILALLGELLNREFPGKLPFISRGCGNPYETLLGPWQGWEKSSPVRFPERLTQVRKGLRESLYKVT